MDADELLATIYDEIKKLKNVVMIDQALDTGKITDKLHTLEIAMDNLAKETKKEVDEDKCWRRRIEIVCNNLNKINTFAVELNGEADVALNEIRLTPMIYILEVAILVGVQVFLDAQRWWTLFTIVMLWFFGNIMIAIKASSDLWRIRRQFKELHEEQNLLYKAGKSLIADSRLAPDCDYGLQLKVGNNEFDKFMSFKKCVAKLPWTYWANFIVFSTFSLAMPILLGFNLDAIVHPCSQPCIERYKLHNLTKSW